MMVVQGMEELESKYGFIPDFHDDHVESISITADRIEMVIRTVDGPSRIQKRNGARFKLTFQGVKEFCLQGEMYGTVSIILDLLFSEKPEGVEAKLETSLGTEGFVLAKEIRIEEI